MPLLPFLLEYFEKIFPLRLFITSVYSVIDQIALNDFGNDSELNGEYREIFYNNTIHPHTINLKINPELFTSLFKIVTAIIAVRILRRIYSLLFEPLNIVKRLNEIGYIPEPYSNIALTASFIQRVKEVGTIPPVFPNGWYGIVESRSLLTGDVRNVNCLGYNLAVFRGEDQKVYALDAYCPHMGSNMGVGGKVKGACLQCPYHGWVFRGRDGRCVKTSICQKSSMIPEKARVNTHRIIERNGFVYFWHHSTGGQPTWEPEVIEEINSKQWTYRGRTEHYAHAHVQEISEGYTDDFYLSRILGPCFLAGSDLRYLTDGPFSGFAHHCFTGSWSRDSERQHVGLLNVSHKFLILGGNLFPFFNYDAVVEQIGPSISHTKIWSQLGDGVVIQTLVPMENTVQRIVQNIYFNSGTPTFLAKPFLYIQAIMTERNLTIWNNKKYQKRPVFGKCQADMDISSRRRWFSQFYDKKSELEIKLGGKTVVLVKEPEDDDDNKNETGGEASNSNVPPIISTTGDVVKDAGKSRVVVCSLSSSTAANTDNRFDDEDNRHKKSRQNSVTRRIMDWRGKWKPGKKSKVGFSVAPKSGTLSGRERGSKNVKVNTEIGNRTGISSDVEDDISVKSGSRYGGSSLGSGEGLSIADDDVSDVGNRAIDDDVSSGVHDFDDGDDDNHGYDDDDDDVESKGSHGYDTEDNYDDSSEYY